MNYNVLEINIVQTGKAEKQICQSDKNSRIFNENQFKMFNERISQRMMKYE